MQRRQETAQLQSQRINAGLIHASAVLQCTNAELVEMLDQELRSNPAVEPVDDPIAGTACDGCPLPAGRPCTTCFYAQGGPADPASETDDSTETDWDDRSPIPDFDRPLAGSEPARDFDVLALAPAPSTRALDIQWQIAGSGKSIRPDVAEYLIDSLDGRGYLVIDAVEACALLGIAEDELEGAIRVIQGCEPAGIGARSLRECILLQLEQWPDAHETPPNPIALAIVRDHWDLFTHNRRGQIAVRLRTGRRDVDSAIAFIQGNLTPYPGGQHREFWRHRPDNLSEAIRPDVTISRSPQGFSVELGSMPLSVQISPYYRRMADQVRSAASKGVEPSPDDRFVLEAVDRAEHLLASIRRRSKMLRRIALLLAERQQGFIETGKRSFLRPITRTELAGDLGVHESTVSRALLHKYVQLPNQDVVSFDCFFVGSPGLPDAIAEMIASEDAAKPLSDHDIAAALAARGISAARRTVTKYREALRLPPSHLRRLR